jgi:hypothetical protein
MHNPLTARWFGKKFSAATSWLVLIAATALAAGMTTRAILRGGDEWLSLVFIVPFSLLCLLLAVGNLRKLMGNADTQARTDEKDKAVPEPPKKRPALFANLTDQDWIDAMERGRKVSEARDEEIRKAIKGDEET